MSIFKDLSEGAVGGFLGAIGSVAKDLRVAITGVDPIKAAEIEQKIIELEAMAMNAQAQINLEEAKSESLFVSGWRPFIGWVGGSALAYVAILEPFISWSARLYGSTVVFPVIDTTITMQVLIGILGLGAYRSYDKKQEPNTKGKE